MRCIRFIIIRSPHRPESLFAWLHQITDWSPKPQMLEEQLFQKFGALIWRHIAWH